MKPASTRKPHRLNLDDPKHQAIRSSLRVVGPIVFLLGLVLAIAGFASFFQAFGSFDTQNMGPPRYFWCVFVGFPLIWLGATLSIPAYMGAASRYMAKEMAPVQRDTFNTMAEGTSDGIRTVAQAIGEGFAAAGQHDKSPANHCTSCGSAHPESARFCPGCGKAI